MKVWYNISIKGYCDGPQCFDINEKDFETVEAYMKDQYAKDAVAQDPSLAGYEFEIRPMYNECKEGVSLKYRDWFETGEDAEARRSAEDEELAKLESKGFKRWTKGDLDRMYIDYEKVDDWARETEQEDTCYKWMNRRERSSGKIWIDVKTGELHTKGIEESDKIIALVKAYIEA